MADPKPQSKTVYRVKRLMKDVALDALFPRLYRQEAAACPNPQKVVFLETKESTMPVAMRHIYERLLTETSYDVEFVTLRQNNSSIPRYYVNCREAVPVLAQARTIFLSDASDLVSALPLRPETTVVQLWHACGAFKKWGMSTADAKFGESRTDQHRHPFYGNLDLVTVSAPEVVWAYEEAMDLQGQGTVQPLGVAATDVYFDPAFMEGARAQVEAAVPQAQGKKIVLYAPTFRGRVRYAQGPDVLDIPAMREALADNYVLLVRHHPYVKQPPAIAQGCDDFAFDVSKMERLAIEALLAAADVLVTDYSSVVFEYALFDRPVCFFAYDKADYDEWRGFYYDYDELCPGPVFADSADLIDYLAHIDARFDRKRVQSFREKFMGACDGHSSDRLLDFAFDGHWRACCRPKAHDVLEQANVGDVDVSIVIPAHNAQEGLRRALAHIEAQTYDHRRMECIVVDDGSSDGTAAVAQEFARRDPELFAVLYIDECSGSPAAPRNVGLAAAHGTYVFFHDADDWLEDDAIERMLDNAVNWGSDVLLVKMFDDDNRGLPQSMFAYSQPDANPYTSKVMWSFAPLKLFRRSLVERLRFPDFMPEDISFVLRAYVEARVVSVAADAFYYHATMGIGEDHASVSTWDNIESNLQAYRDIFGYIEQHVPDKKRDAVLMRRLFWRDVYRTLCTIAHEDDERAQRYYQELIALAKPFWRVGMYKTCPQPERCVLQAAFEGGLAELRQAAVVIEDECDV